MRAPKFFQFLSRPANTTTARFTIEGMTCAGCAARIEKAICALPGIHLVNIDLESAKATVEHEATRTTPDQIRDAIIAAGYKVEG